MIPLLLGGSLLAIGGTALRWSGLLGDDGLIDLPDGEDIGEAIADSLEVIFDAMPPILASFSVGVVDGIAESTKAVRGALEGRESAFMQGTTMIIIGWAMIRTMKAVTGGVRVA